MNIKKILNPINIKDGIIKLIRGIPGFIKTIYLSGSFFMLLFIYLFDLLFGFFERIPLLGKLFSLIRKAWNAKLNPLFVKLTERIEKSRGTQVKSLYLIQLAHRNLLIKKTRSFITILGMSVGVGIIVLLLSLGYGIERLIVNRVARLEELKMVDVSAGENTTTRLNKSILDKFKKINNVEKAIPLISVVGRINYNRATTDVLVYTTPKSYLDAIKVKLREGKIYTNDRTIEKKSSANTGDSKGQVAGAQVQIVENKYNTRIEDKAVKFNVYPDKSVIVWSNCGIYSKILGYIGRIEGGFYRGVKYWGGDYYPFEQGGRVAYDKSKEMFLGRWIKAKLPLYQKDENGTLVRVVDEKGDHRWEEGCVQEKDLKVSVSEEEGSVLGEATSSADLASASDSATIYDVVSASDSAGLETVSMASSSATTKKTSEVLKFQSNPDGEAVVSSGFINLLGIPENKAVGTKFKSSFIIVKSLIPEIDGRVFTSEVEYKIIGVVDDPETTYFYVPFTDIYQLNIKNFSQLKLVLKNSDVLPKVRKEIETAGFRTSSTVDTVKQIESLFANLRIVLAILGLVALGVAALGMFNTLTVSLLERTREIGGMKAMGMVSQEVQDLFLAEAMIMGLAGGLGGLLLGYLGGELLSLAISLVAIASGQGYIHLNYIPFYFVVFIIISSFVVGVLTGLYPAQRAKKISALNALRYE